MSGEIRILLVDDHASTREPLAFMLEQEPDLTVVSQAGTLAEARSSIADLGDRVDLAIVDLGLPDGSGEELIPELRATSPGAASLVLTHFSDRERLARAVGAGASGVMHKSASVEEVMDAVRLLYQGEQLLSYRDVMEALQVLDQERRRERETGRSYEQLTVRELEVLQALADGLSDRDIAERFSVGTATVRTHVTNILAKLDASSRLQALVTGIRLGIVSIA
jgi:DNA-binding NarL/FixJ family response regulator